MKTIDIVQQLDTIKDLIAAGDWGKSEPWRGADVCIVDAAPVSHPNGWLPDDDYIITPYVRELSWVFEQARNAVWEHEGFGAFKYEYFGRMGEAVNACGTDVPITTHLNVALFAARFFVSSVLDRRGQ